MRTSTNVRRNRIVLTPTKKTERQGDCTILRKTAITFFFVFKKDLFWTFMGHY